MPRQVFRKPHGQGKLACQRAVRGKLTREVGDTLLSLLDEDTVEATGNLFPRKLDFRRRAIRPFLSLQKYSGRVFTRKLCHSIVRYVVGRLPFSLPRAPRSSLDEVIQAQATRLQKLAKRSKRIAVPKPVKKLVKKPVKMSTTDQLDTLPYEPWLQFL